MAETEKLIVELKRGEPQSKQAAFQQLISAGEKSVQLLLEAIENSSAEQIEMVLSAIDWEQNGENQKSDEPFVAFRDLAKYDYWFVLAAVHFFEVVGAGAVKPLTRLFLNPAPGIRAWTAYTLGVIGDLAAIPVLVARLATESDEERVRVVDALGKLKAKEAVPKIVEFLDHSHEYTQYVAAGALGAIRDPIAITPLLSDLKKHKHNVYAVSAALGLFGKLAVEPLIKLLLDEGASRVHDLIIMNLWLIGDPRAIPPLIDVVKASHDTALQWNAIQGLGYLKARQAIQPIADVFYATNQADLRLVCAQAIAQAGGAEAYGVLVHAIEHGDFDLQHSAILAMGEFTPIAEFDLTPLLAMLQENNSYLRSASAVALGNLGDSRASAALTMALNDPDPTVEQYVIDALGKIGDLHVKRALETKLQSENQFIQRAAREALEKLGKDSSSATRE